jgi:sialate O-acetylesterase
MYKFSGMKKHFIVLVSVMLLWNTTVLKANVTLPAIISSGMVLQQQSNASLWGTAKANAKVTVQTSWNQKVYNVNTTKEGTWRLAVATPKAGGPYKITFNDGSKLVVDDVFIGEVWLCSGQSNMEMPVKGYANQPILNSNDILMDADEPGIRLFRVEKKMSKTPQTQLDAKWQSADAASVKEFSAVGYQFARILQKRLKVPVGIIQSAFGGTDIEAWMTTSSLQGFNDFKVPADTAKIMKNNPGVLFNAMINPIIGYSIKGTLWYQGENNRMNPLTYDKKMAAMVKQWRQLWNCGEWPFYYVQIAPNVYKDHADQIPLLYEAQSRAMKLIPNSGMAVSVDVGSMTTIHPPDKTIISKRLAYWALSNTYGKQGIVFRGPVYKSLEITDGKAVLSFDEIPNGLTAYDKKLISFEIAGSDKVFYPAEALIKGKTVVVQRESVKSPVAVRYAFKDRAEGNLYNVEGLPAEPFRTDSW